MSDDHEHEVVDCKVWAGRTAWGRRRAPGAGQIDREMTRCKSAVILDPEQKWQTAARPGQDAAQVELRCPDE